jgi:hypothetical protein
MNRRIHGFHVIHCIHAGHASFYKIYVAGCRSNLSNESHYPRDDDEIVADDRVTQQHKQNWHLVVVTTGSGLKSGPRKW